MIRQFQRMSRPLQRRLQLLAARAILTLVNDRTPLQTLQVQAFADNIVDGIERIQNYGFTSHPKPGAPVVMISFGGHQQHSVAIAVDDRRHRPTGLGEGEVCIYTAEDDPVAGELHRIILKRGRIVEIEGAEIRLKAGSSSMVMKDGGTVFTTPRFDRNSS